MDMLNKLKDNITQNEMDGLVWILNGRVFVRNEMKLGMPPVINPCEGVKLYINGIECNHLTTVREEDEIELKPVDKEIDFKLDVEISADKLKAYATYTPPRVVKNVIVDTYPVNKLDVQVTEVLLETRKVTVQQLPDYLKNECRIVFGINESVLESICKNNTAGRFLIAEGVPAQEAVDDWIEYFFDENDFTENKIRENEQGKVDFKNVLSFKSVHPGQVIAQLHKGKTGSDGIAVDGEVIAARQPKKLTIVPTYSISYDENTGAVKAIKPGRPTKQVKGESVSFQIYDTISVDEVSIKTGNVKFKGDIEVKENVFESMEVLAKQNVLVKGNVNFASILAGNNITIKGAVISSKINAAMSDTIAKDPAPLMGKLIDGINRLIGNMNTFYIQDITAHNIKDIPDVVRCLLNGRNKELPGIVYEVLNELKKGSYDVEEDFIIEFMKKTRPLMGNYSQINNVQYLNNVVSNLKALFTEKDKTKIKGSVALNSVLNSDVLALGDVTISGKGCFNARIFSNGKVVVAGDVRGGQIIAEKGIEINTSGSDMGVKTLLIVPENSYINIKTAHPDTTIKIGGASYTFLSEKKLVRARLVNGKILF